MIKLSKQWKKIFWGFSAATGGLVILSLVTHFMPFFLLGMICCVIVVIMAISRLRCPNCGKILIYDAIKTKLDGEVTCPGCKTTYTIEADE